MKKNRGINARIVAIDMIRGVAILGIFIVNMMSFHSPFMWINPLNWWFDPLDRFTYMLIDIFAQASFYPIFAMMFGYSFVLLREKVENRDLSFFKIGTRRLGLLMVAGALHAFFVWHGDILLQYAVLGFPFLFFLSLSGKRLLALGLSLYIIPAIFLAALLFFVGSNTPDPGLCLDEEACRRSLKIYAQGTFGEITTQRVADWWYTNNPENLPFLFIGIFPLFLIGAGVAKLKWLAETERHRKKLTLILFISLMLGLVLKVFPYLFNGAMFAEFVQDTIGGVSLGVFYATLIVRMSESVQWIKWLTPLAAVGKMSLSNYLFQSFLSTLIFYHYGLGLYGKLSLFGGTVMVLVIYFMQVLFSRLWLKRFSYGPVEWLWRMGTYKGVISFRKKYCNF
jgi:uncharacterized protein